MFVVLHTLPTKLAIVTYIEKNPIVSKKSAASQFNITTKQIHEWIRLKSKLKNALPYIKQLNIGTRSKYLLLEVDLTNWIKGLCSQHKIVSQQMMGEEIKKLTSKGKKPEARSKENNFIYTYVNNLNNNKSIVDLTYNDNDVNNDGDNGNSNDSDNGESSDDNDGGSENLYENEDRYKSSWNKDEENDRNEDENEDGNKNNTDNPSYSDKLNEEDTYYENKAVEYTNL
ncbi:875_t:CDS:2 [Cetraspora pellucida]|uniref:875_t:CDS:1 n=1 Tax=Cetraspora pellucida TaxID=1433469 RepID=A0A9N9J0L0_9GLOM|nr:875_t:CDS:2 [Cetraspora pellucida]